MATIHIVYFDTDATEHRAEVMRSAGYAVDECSSVPELADCLRTKQGADLVCIADAWKRPAEGALALARALSWAPIVLFRCGDHHYIQRGWDLEVPPLTAPGEWLADIEKLLATPRTGSRKLQWDASPSREEITAARGRSAPRPGQQNSGAESG